MIKSQVHFVCDKCGKEIIYNSDLKTDQDIITKNQCWHISLPQAHYGSKLDGMKPTFDLCDDCLYELLKQLNRLEGG